MNTFNTYARSLQQIGLVDSFEHDDQAHYAVTPKAHMFSSPDFDASQRVFDTEDAALGYLVSLASQWNWARRVGGHFGAEIAPYPDDDTMRQLNERSMEAYWAIRGGRPEVA